MEDFILDPELSIYLGARYFQEELLRKLGGDPLFALMAHLSGAPAVREWVEKWKTIGRANDYEFMVETARHQAVGPFVRSVLAASWIAQSAKIYKGN
jgi:soluble lytic murein transglycosylase-like protein